MTIGDAERLGAQHGVRKFLRLRGIATYSLVNYGAMAFGLVTGPLTVRSLGASGKGVTAEVAIYSALFGIVFAFGVQSGLTHHAAVHPERRSQLFGGAIRIAIGVTPFAWLAAAGMALGPLRALPTTEKVLAAVVLALSPLVVFSNFLQAFLVARGSLGSLALARTIPIWVPGVAVIVLFAAGSLSVSTYLIASIVAIVAQVAVSLWQVRLRPTGSVALGPLIKFGAKGSLGSLMIYINVSLDQAIAGPFLGTAQLGYYSVAVTVASLPSTLVLAFAYRSFGPVAQAGRDQASIDDGITGPREGMRQVQFAFTTVLVLVAVIVALSPVLLPLLYGQHYASHVLLPLYLLAPGMVAMGVWGMVVNALVALGRPGLGSLVQVPGLVLTVAGLPIGLSLFGIDGAAGVSTLSYVAVALCSVICLQRLAGGRMLRGGQNSPRSRDRKDRTR